MQHGGQLEEGQHQTGTPAAALSRILRTAMGFLARIISSAVRPSKSGWGVFSHARTVSGLWKNSWRISKERFTGLRGDWAASAEGVLWIVREELKRLGWEKGDLPRRRKGDEGKAAVARRLRTCDPASPSRSRIDRNVRCPIPILKGLYPSARGCSRRATPGGRRIRPSTLNGLHRLCPLG